MPDQEWVEITSAHSDDTARVTRVAWDRVWSQKVDDKGAPVWSLVEGQPSDPVAKPATVKASVRDADKPGGNA